MEKRMHIIEIFLVNPIDAISKPLEVRRLSLQLEIKKAHDEEGE